VEVTAVPTTHAPPIDDGDYAEYVIDRLRTRVANQTATIEALIKYIGGVGPRPSILPSHNSDVPGVLRMLGIDHGPVTTPRLIPVKWHLAGPGLDPDPRSRYAVFMEVCPQPDGAAKYAVSLLGEIFLNRDGEWEVGVGSWHRDSEFLDRTRFATIEDALAALERTGSPAAPARE
jgi:hypothetical protein